MLCDLLLTVLNRRSPISDVRHVQQLAEQGLLCRFRTCHVSFPSFNIWLSLCGVLLCSRSACQRCCAVLGIGVYSVGLSCGCVVSVLWRGHGWVKVSCLHCMFAVRVFIHHASYWFVMFASSPKYITCHIFCQSSILDLRD
jgi:hypothetical protein